MSDDILGNPITDPTNYLNDLVGEGKKFRDLESLARGKHESDVYIKTLERQLDQIRSDYSEARSELTARAKFEELADRFNNRRDPPVQVESKPAFDENQLKTIVARQIEETETQRKQEENFKMVQSKLSETFGLENVESKLKEVGLDGRTAASIAKTAPELVLKALGINQPPQQPQFQPPPRNAGFNQPIEKERTWSYYQEMFQKDPKLKFDPKTNVQMQKDYIRLGTKFEDGDFNRFDNQ
jgi:hypothetical protein